MDEQRAEETQRKKRFTTSTESEGFVRPGQTLTTLSSTPARACPAEREGSGDPHHISLGSARLREREEPRDAARRSLPCPLQPAPQRR